MDDKEFRELLIKYDHPDHLVKMATTAWQKAVAIEFVHQDKRMQKIETNMKWIKWLTVSIFGASIIGLVCTFINSIPIL